MIFPTNIRNLLIAILMAIGLFFSAGYALERESHDLDLAIALFDKNAYDLAIEQLDKVLLKNESLENKRQVFFYLAESYKNLNNLDKAQAYYRQVLTAAGYGYADIAIFELGMMAFGQADYTSAIKDFEMLGRRYPYSKFYQYARFWRAESFYKLEKFDLAKQIYIDLIAESPAFEYADFARYALALIYISQENFSAAKKLFFFLSTASNPQLKESVQYYLGSMYFQTGEHPQARALLEKYLATYPAGRYFKESSLLLGELAYERIDYPAAIAYFSKLVSDNRFAEQALQSRAWAYHQLGRWSDSLSDLSSFLSLSSDPVRRSKAFYLEALILNKTQKYAASEQTLGQINTTANEQTLNDKVALLHIMNAYQQGNWPALLNFSRQYETSSAADASNDLLTFQTGVAYYKTQQFQPCLQRLTRLQLPEYRSKAAYFIADIYYRNNDYVNAKSYFADIVAQQPEHPNRLQAMYSLAWCAYQTGSYKDSARYFDEFIQKYPQAPLSEKAAFLKAESYLNMYAYQEALQTLTSFLGAYPKSSLVDMARFYQAYAMYKLEKLYDAVNGFEQYVRVGKNPVLVEKAMYWEASAYFRLREWEKTRLIFVQLLQSNPLRISLVEVYQKLGDACYNSKDYTAALDYYKIGLSKFQNSDWGKQLHSSMIYALIKLDRIEDAKLEADRFVQQYGDRAAIEPLLNQIAMREKIRQRDIQ